MVRRPSGAVGVGFHRNACGLRPRGVDVMGDAVWWRQRVEARGVLET